MKTKALKSLAASIGLLITPGLCFAAESAINKTPVVQEFPAVTSVTVKESNPTKGGSLTPPVPYTFIALEFRFGCKTDIPNPPASLPLRIYSWDGLNPEISATFRLLNMRVDAPSGQLVLTYAFYHAIPFGDYDLMPEGEIRLNSVEWGHTFDDYGQSPECSQRIRQVCGQTQPSRSGVRYSINSHPLNISEETPFIQFADSPLIEQDDSFLPAPPPVKEP